MDLLEGVILFLKVIGHFMYCYFEAFVRVFKPPSKKSIEGEIVLVTGGGHGIGRQLAIDLSKLGTTIVLWDINQENNEGVAKEINEAGGKAFAYTCDVSSSSQIANAAAKVRDEVGDVSMLVNNAGISNIGYFMDLEEKDIRRVYDVNILSHFWMNKEFMPSMIKNKHGHIINVASMASFFPNPVITDYCSTKYAVIGLADSLDLELKVRGITGIHISNLCPMFTETGMCDDYHNVMSPMLMPEDVSRVAVDGILRNYETITVPENMYYVNKFLTMLPRRAQKFMITFGLIRITPQYKKNK